MLQMAATGPGTWPGGRPDASRDGRIVDDFAIYLGEPVSTAAHVAFDAPDRASVDGFYEPAIASGGREKGPPGVWTRYSERYYAAFAYDPEGNNVEAVFHSPEPIHDAPRRPGVP